MHGFPERLRTIYGELLRVLKEHEPLAVAIEEMFFLKAAHTIRASLQARGVILLAAAQARKPISEYNPRAVKLSLTGSGSAAKAQMQSAVQKSLGLKEKLRPDDVADAAAVALCHLRSQRISRLKVLARFGGRPAAPDFLKALAAKSPSASLVGPQEKRDSP
jgi:crossover junction endodeoxyribonuclease RuvC